MTNYQLTHAVADEIENLNDGRDVRALTESMDVQKVDDHKYRVESGSTYTVDTQLGACTCPDHAQRNVHCKHLRRVTYVTGMRPIPVEANEIPEVSEALSEGKERLELTVVPPAPEPEEPEIGADLEAERRLVESQEPHASAATDGGQTQDEAAADEICGAECKDGTPCEWPLEDCPVESHAGRRGEALDDGETGAEAGQDGQDGEVRSVGVAYADGGDQAFEADVGRVIQSAIDAADEGSTVVIVLN